MTSILTKLKGGDLRSIGRADEVVKDILNDPSLFEIVFEGMVSDDPLIRMRAADAIEKVSSSHPEYLQPYKTKLINEVSKIDQQEVQWHAAQMFGYLKLTKNERDKIILILFTWLDGSKSNIVRVFSMQALADIAEKDEKLRSKMVKRLKDMKKKGSPSIASRSKKLLTKLEKI